MKFEKMDLTIENVDALFNYCIAGENMEENDCEWSMLFSRVTGYDPEDEVLVYFDKNRISENKGNIKHLFTQLKPVADKADKFTLNDCLVKADGSLWDTQGIGAMELLYLAASECTSFMSVFYKFTESAEVNYDKL